MAVSISECTDELVPNVFVLFLVASLLAETAVVSWQFCRECCSGSDIIICWWLYIDWQAHGGGVLIHIIQICCVLLCFLIPNFMSRLATYI